MKRFIAILLLLCFALPVIALGAEQSQELSADGITVLRNHDESKTDQVTVAVDYPSFLCDDPLLMDYLENTITVPFRALLPESGYSVLRSGFNVNMDYPNILSFEGTVTTISEDTQENNDVFFWRMIDLENQQELNLEDLFEEDQLQVSTRINETVFGNIQGQQLETITSAQQIPPSAACYLDKEGLTLFYAAGTLHKKNISLTIPFSVLPLTLSDLLDGEGKRLNETLDDVPETPEQAAEPAQVILPSEEPPAETFTQESPVMADITPQPAPQLDPHFTLPPVVTPTPMPLEATDAEILQVLCRGVWKQLGTDGQVYYQFLPDGKMLTISVSDYSLSNGELTGLLNGTIDIGSESAFTLWDENDIPSGYVLNRQGEAVAPEEFVTPSPTPEPTATPAPTDTPAPTPTPSPEPTPVPTPTLSPYEIAVNTLPVIVADENASFEKRQTKQVFTAPSDEAYQVEGAQVDTNDQAQVYGITSDGWIMIGYPIGNKNTKGRIGYIKEGTLLSPETTQKLSFAAMPYVVAHNCKATDDPLWGQKPMMEIKAGSTVTLLAFFETDWVYVETTYEEMLCRVFIPRSAIMEE